jgi:D-alanine--poly(phosphoribitol) ligase subunit 1
MRMLLQIRDIALNTPGRAAHVSGSRVMTYGELWERSDALAAELLAAAPPGDRSPVVVRGHKEPEMLVAFLAVVKAGRPYVPIDASVPEERAQRIIRSSGAGRVLEAAGLWAGEAEAVTGGAAWAGAVGAGAVGAGAVGAGAGAVGSAGPGLPVPGPGPGPEHWVTENDVFYIIYTSGSTGEPKGVQITGGCLQSFVDWMLAEQRFAPGAETFLNQAPFSFDLSVMDLYGSLVTGGTLFSLEKAAVENPRRLFETLAASGVTVWVSTPSFAMMCLAEKSFGRSMLPRLNRFLFCGETLPPECAVRLAERFPGAQVWNTYGPTEATVATTSVLITPEVLERYPALPVGYPKPDSVIRVVDAEGRPVAEGERGEIIIAGPHVSIGYLGNPEQTAKAFFCLDAAGAGQDSAGLRAYRTGDWGRYRDGLLFFEGRMDFQIKLHGYRIELGDIETHLRALPEVDDAVVLPALKDGAAQWLAAFVVLRERPAGSDFAVTQQLRTALGARLPAYMLPRKFFYREAFPMTPNGKADRRRLAEELA